MKELLQNKIITALVVTATFILAGVAVFTAVRLYQVRNESVTPTTPTQSDAAGTLAPPSAPRVLRNTTWKESDPPESGETHGSLDYASSKDEAWIAVRNNGTSGVLIKGWQNCPPRHDPDGICWPKTQDPTFEFTIQPKEVVRVEAVQVCGQLDFDQPYGYGRYFDTIKCSGSSTATPTKTPTPTIKITGSPTKTPTITATKTPTPTVKSSATPTKTPTPTVKVTGSPTPTNTVGPSPTGPAPVLQSCKALTFTLSSTTGTPTKTPTPTSTGTITPTVSGTVTVTPTLTDVPRGGGDTPTNTPTPTNTGTGGPTPTTGNGSSPTPTTSGGNIAHTSPTPEDDLPNAGIALPTLFAAGLGGLVFILAIALAL
jgi:hypothetical protein